MLEKQIESHLRCKVKACGGLALKFTSPGFAGVPDRLVLTPNGGVYFVETKAPGKKMSPRQVKVAKVLLALGQKVWLVDSAESINDFISEVFGSVI